MNLADNVVVAISLGLFGCGLCGVSYPISYGCRIFGCSKPFYVTGSHDFRRSSNEGFRAAYNWPQTYSKIPSRFCFVLYFHPDVCYHYKRLIQWISRLTYRLLQPSPRYLPETESRRVLDQDLKPKNSLQLLGLIIAREYSQPAILQSNSLLIAI